MSAPQITLFVQADPIRAAGAVKRHMSMRGMGPAPRGGLAEISFSITSCGPGRWIAVSVEPAEGCDETLAAVLSQTLRCQGVVVVRADELLAWRVFQNGVQQDSVGVVRGELVEGEGGECGRRIRQGESPEAVLASTGAPTHLSVSSGEAEFSFGFCVKRRAGQVPALELDPGLSCPECASPMLKRTGRRGLFFGCVRFPDCRGTLSEAQAEEARGAGEG